MRAAGHDWNQKSTRPTGSGIMRPDISTQPVDDTRGIMSPDVEPIEFEEIATAENSQSGNSHSGTSQSEPAQSEAAPGWFANSRDQKPPRSDAKRRRRRKKKPLIVARKEVPLTWQQELHHRLFGKDGAGFGVSLIVHIVLLLLLSLQLASQMEGDGDFTALGSFGEAELDGLEEVADAAVEDSGGQDETEVVPETEPVTVAETETKEPEPDPEPEPQPPQEPVKNSSGNGNGNTEGDGTDGASGPAGKFGKTGNAVAKGSFTVWTVPENPEPDRYYDIVIQIKVPEGTKSLRSTDLSGVIIGDDSKIDIRFMDYRQIIPWDKTKSDTTSGPYVKYPGRPLKRLASPSRTSRGRAPFLPVRKGYATLIIKVPGGARKVTDTVVINSKMLKESQTLKIQFAGSR